MRRIYLVLAFAGLMALPAFNAWGASCEDVTMPDSVTIGGESLTLNGLGVREATIMSVNVYVAGLYLQSTTSSGDSIVGTDQPRHLVLEFVRDVDADDIAEAFQDGFESDYGRFQVQVDMLNSYIGNMHDGEQLVFSYIPGEGTTVTVDGSVQGTVEGADFAARFIQIWVGDDPPNDGLKEGMLGGECG